MKKRVLLSVAFICATNLCGMSDDAFNNKVIIPMVKGSTLSFKGTLIESLAGAVMQSGMTPHLFAQKFQGNLSRVPSILESFYFDQGQMLGDSIFVSSGNISSSFAGLARQVGNEDLSQYLLGLVNDRNNYLDSVALQNFGSYELGDPTSDSEEDDLVEQYSSLY